MRKYWRRFTGGVGGSVWGGGGGCWVVGVFGGPGRWVWLLRVDPLFYGWGGRGVSFGSRTAARESVVVVTPDRDVSFILGFFWASGGERGDGAGGGVERWKRKRGGVRSGRWAWWLFCLVLGLPNALSCSFTRTHLACGGFWMFIAGQLNFSPALVCISHTRGGPIRIIGSFPGRRACAGRHGCARWPVNRFTQSDLDVFDTLAGQIVVALENARLFEESQRISERLREVDRLKSEFLANMSHELRTPLNSVIGYAEMLLMTLADTLDDDTLEDIRAIYENGMHLLHIINDTLDLAKIEAGRMNLRPEKIDLYRFLEDIHTNNQGLLLKSRKPLEFRLSTPPGLLPVCADPVRLSQVLNNLVSNAIKFTEHGHIDLRAYRDGNCTYLEVQDTGIGIAADDLEKIFDKFRQVDGSSRRRSEGTGRWPDHLSLVGGDAWRRTYRRKQIWYGQFVPGAFARF